MLNNRSESSKAVGDDEGFLVGTGGHLGHVVNTRYSVPFKLTEVLLLLSYNSAAAQDMLVAAVVYMLCLSIMHCCH